MYRSIYSMFAPHFATVVPRGRLFADQHEYRLGSRTFGSASPPLPTGGAGDVDEALVKRHQPWSVVLASGHGESGRPQNDRRVGPSRPRQYSTVVGTRSMLQHAVDRALLLSPEQVVTVVARQHRSLAVSALIGKPLRRLIQEPRYCGTAPALLLALTYIRRLDPDAVVVLLPSDHFVHPEDRFLGAVRSAAAFVRHHQESLVVLGCPPDGGGADSGWITPGMHQAWVNGFDVWAARELKRKPGSGSPQPVAFQGALANTTVSVARADTWWTFGRDCRPDVMSLFERLCEAVDTSREAYVLEAIFQVMPQVDVSETVLSSTRQRLSVLALEGVTWSDWGTSERIVSSLQRIGRLPGFLSVRTPTYALRAAGD